MTRLIDADALVKDICENYIFTGFAELLEDFASAIRSQPTVDAVPVRHGKWIEHKDYPAMAYLCSECGFFTTMPTHHYCPNCGAKMDGAERKEHETD